LQLGVRIIRKSAALRKIDVNIRLAAG